MRVVVELGLASSVFVLSECSPPNRLGSSCSNCCHGRNRAPTPRPPHGSSTSRQHPEPTSARRWPRRPQSPGCSARTHSTPPTRPRGRGSPRPAPGVRLRRTPLHRPAPSSEPGWLLPLPGWPPRPATPYGGRPAPPSSETTALATNGPPGRSTPTRTRPPPTTVRRPTHPRPPRPPIATRAPHPRTSGPNSPLVTTSRNPP